MTGQPWSCPLVCPSVTLAISERKGSSSYPMSSKMSLAEELPVTLIVEESGAQLINARMNEIPLLSIANTVANTTKYRSDVKMNILLIRKVNTIVAMNVATIWITMNAIMMIWRLYSSAVERITIG